MNDASAPPTIDSAKNRRRKPLISTLQVKATALALVLSALASLALWREFYGSLNNLQKSIAHDFPDAALLVRVSTFSQVACLGMLLKIILIMIILWITTIFVFHFMMVVGPLYRIKVCLNSIKEGKFVSRMNLRKNDLLTDVRDSFNAMAEVLENRDKNLQENLKEVQAILDGLSKKATPSSHQELTQALEILRRLQSDNDHSTARS